MPAGYRRYFRPTVFFNSANQFSAALICAGRIPHGEAQTLLREAYRAVDHYAYDDAPIVLPRRMTDDWNDCWIGPAFAVPAQRASARCIMHRPDYRD